MVPVNYLQINAHTNWIVSTQKALNNSNSKIIESIELGFNTFTDKYLEQANTTTVDPETTRFWTVLHKNTVADPEGLRGSLDPPPPPPPLVFKYVMKMK